MILTIIYLGKKMGIIVNKQDSDDEITRRINADLRAKALETVEIDDEVANPDLAEDAEYLKDLKKTGRFGWVWLVLIGLAILSVISIVAM